jgi:hypothetical protein
MIICVGAWPVVQSVAAGDADLGFELCYLEVPGAERCVSPGSWPGLRPEEFLPVRGFRWARGQGHLPGLWWSATTGAHVGYESWLERDHVMLLDFDPEVVAIAAQPFWLHWRDGSGRSRRHAPDLFARMADGSAVVIDVRPDDRIEPRDAEAFGATGRACELAGWRFVRAGVPDPVRTANVGWLSRYRHQRCGSADMARLLLKVFAEPTPLMTGAAAAGDPLAVLPVLFHLLWRHVLAADVAVRLTAETLVSPGGRACGGGR